jgi:hypothetical protein
MNNPFKQIKEIMLRERENMLKHLVGRRTVIDIGDIRDL